MTEEVAFTKEPTCAAEVVDPALRLLNGLTRNIIQIHITQVDINGRHKLVKRWNLMNVLDYKSHFYHIPYIESQSRKNLHGNQRDQCCNIRKEQKKVLWHRKFFWSSSPGKDVSPRDGQRHLEALARIEILKVDWKNLLNLMCRWKAYIQLSSFSHFHRHYSNIHSEK